MNKCSTKQIEKLREAEASEETLDFVEQYFDIKDMEKKGMLLDPEELDIIQQVDEIADSAQLGNRWGTALVSMKKDIIDEARDNFVHTYERVCLTGPEAKQLFRQYCIDNQFR